MTRLRRGQGELPHGTVLRPGTRAELVALCLAHHAYAGAGAVGQIWTLARGGAVEAVFSCQPPPYGAASAIAPAQPAAVLALSRMAAVPRAERDYDLSPVLRYLLDERLDRTRWPVVATWSDRGLGHTGAVYCQAGLRRGPRVIRPTWTDATGARRAQTAGGGRRVAGLTRGPDTVLRLWTDRVCRPGDEAEWLADHDWRRVRLAGTWRSGAPAHRWERARPERADLP